MKVYVDDMLVKSASKRAHFVDLKEMCNVLRKYKMRLNLLKCAFDVSSSKFLGFIVTNRRIYRS